MVRLSHRREVTAQIECDGCRCRSLLGEQIVYDGGDPRVLWAAIRNAVLCLRGLLIWHGWAVVSAAGGDEPPVLDLCPACAAKPVLARAGGEPCEDA